MIRENKGWILKNDDGSEIVNYDVPGFPSYCYNGYIYPGCRWEKIPHFHEDVEICAQRKGTSAYCVNGKDYVLHEGETIFINSGCVHYSYANQDERSYYTIIVAHPNILCSSYNIERKFVLPVTENSERDVILFKNDCKYGRKMFKDCINLNRYVGDEFLTTKQFFEIWSNILASCDDLFDFKGHADPRDPHIEIFKAMLTFIRTSYNEKITLDDIASRGRVSRTMCNNLFKKFAGNSPFEELTKVRLRKVSEYLTDSSLSMGDIALETGFSSANYMTELFKREYGISPREYRNGLK